MERRVQQRILVDALAAASWIGGLLVTAAAFGILIWLRAIVDLKLSGWGRLAAHDGQFIALLGWVTCSNLIPNIRPPLLVTRTDPAGNRLLQLMSRDLTRQSDALLNSFGLGLLVFGFVAFASFFIAEDFRGGGDRPLGFLAGFGSMTVVIGPLVLLSTAVRRIAPKLLKHNVAQRSAV